MTGTVRLLPQQHSSIEFRKDRREALFLFHASHFRGLKSAFGGKADITM